MTNQKKRILESAGYIKSRAPKNFNADTALIAEHHYKFPKEIKILSKINFKKVPPSFKGIENVNGCEILFSKIEKKDVIIIKGRLHFYDGISMRDIGHIIYVLKTLGIKKIISIDEVALLNPRFKRGELALIYDHINLMGDNPLIGENDESLGLRFPDMSNAYDKNLSSKTYKLFQDNKIKINESVFLGIIGPESETEAEARFYREIGSDVLGYSIVPENITAVHAHIKFLGIGLIARELIADKMLDDNTSEEIKEKEKIKFRGIANNELNKVLVEMVNKL